MKNRYFWKDCLNLCPESSTINQQITFKNCALNTKLQKTLTIWAKIQVFKTLPAKTLWSGDPTNFQNYVDFRREISIQIETPDFIQKVKQELKNKLYKQTYMYFIQLFRYFFEGTQFLRRGRQFIDFSPKSRRFALASSKLSESQRKTSASGPKYRQNDCRNKILKTNDQMKHFDDF